MSIASPQYDKFIEETVRTSAVYTFTNNQEYLVYPVGQMEVIPFWSSRSRLERIQESLPKYTAYEITELPFQKFYEWLPQLEKDNIHIGVNWSGKKLTGYNVSVSDIKMALDYQINQK